MLGFWLLPSNTSKDEEILAARCRLLSPPPSLSLPQALGLQLSTRRAGKTWRSRRKGRHLNHWMIKVFIAMNSLFPCVVAKNLKRKSRWVSSNFRCFCSLMVSWDHQTASGDRPSLTYAEFHPRGQAGLEHGSDPPKKLACTLQLFPVCFDLYFPRLHFGRKALKMGF